jgi:hypothetical protein
MKNFKSFLNKIINETNNNQDTLPTNSKEIINFVEQNSYLVYYGLEDDQLLFNTRENGSVGNEKASDLDIKEAKRVAHAILKKYNNVTVDFEVVDEWVHLTVKEKIEKIDEFIYIFKKDMNNKGFSQGFYSMKELIEKFGTWINVNWEEIIKKVDAIDKFPKNEFTGWHNSYPLLIKSVDEKDNEWNYNFYIIKSKKD